MAMPAFPDPLSRTDEGDGIKLKQKLSSLFILVKSYLDALGEQVAVFAHSGVLATGTGTLRFRFPWPVTLLGVSAAVGTAPSGASLILDVNKNGSTVFSTQSNRPTITSGSVSTSSEPTPNVTTIAAGDYITIDFDQIGSTAAGADITVFVRYRRA